MPMRESDDYITARAANPWTGQISPSVAGTPMTPENSGAALRTHARNVIRTSPSPTKSPLSPHRLANEGKKIKDSVTKTWLATGGTCRDTSSASLVVPNLDLKARTTRDILVAQSTQTTTTAVLRDDEFVVKMPSGREPQPYTFPGSNGSEIQAFEHYKRKAKRTSGDGYDRRLLVDSRIPSNGCVSERQQQLEKQDVRLPSFFQQSQHTIGHPAEIRLPSAFQSGHPQMTNAEAQQLSAMQQGHPDMPPAGNRLPVADITASSANVRLPTAPQSAQASAASTGIRLPSAFQPSYPNHPPTSTLQPSHPNFSPPSVLQPSYSPAEVGAVNIQPLNVVKRRALPGGSVSNGITDQGYAATLAPQYRNVSFDQQVNMPSTYRNVPSSRQDNIPSTYRDISSGQQINIPSTYRDVPSSQQVDIPSTYRDVSSGQQVNIPGTYRNFSSGGRSACLPPTASDEYTRHVSGSSASDAAVAMPSVAHLNQLPRVRLVHPSLASTPVSAPNHESMRKCSLGCTQTPSNSNCAAARKSSAPHTYPLFHARSAEELLQLPTAEATLELMEVLLLAISIIWQSVRDFSVQQVAALGSLFPRGLTTWEKILIVRSVFALLVRIMAIGIVIALTWRLTVVAIQVLRLVFWPLDVLVKATRWMMAFQ